MAKEKGFVVQCKDCMRGFFKGDHHECLQEDLALTKSMNLHSSITDAVAEALNQARNLTRSWCNLKCNHPQLRLPIKFTEDMLELDRIIDKLEGYERERDSIKLL